MCITNHISVRIDEGLPVFISFDHHYNFLYLYCHFSLACYLLSFFHHVSNVNLLCKKERKYLRAVFGDAWVDTPQQPGGGTESSLPVHLSHHLEITIRAKEKPRTPEHICYVCLLSGVCPKETRTSGTISAPSPCTQPLQPTLWPHPLIPTLFFLLLFQNMFCSTLSFSHWLAKQVSVA